MKKYIYPIITGISFGLIGVLIRLINNEVPIMTVISLRTIIGFLFFLLVIPRIDKNYLKITKKDIFNFAIIGVLLAFSMTLFQRAFLSAPVSNVEFLFSIDVIIIGALSFIFLREKITAREVITVIIAMIGIYVMNPFYGSYVEGNLLAIMSAVFFSIVIVYMRYIDKTHSISTIFWIFMFSALALSPFPFIYGLGNISEVWYYILTLGILCTGIAYLSMTYALEKLKAEDVSITLIIFEPLTAVILSIFLLAEFPEKTILIGGLLLLLAAVVFETRNKELQKA
ncbi:DMT family transporter [Candidatus Woesearchaeota archaeon]|nr:DMT family transporter [Candidatus Woesearchaeota archaeon]